MLKVQEIAYHRNGVMGEGFHVVAFTEDGHNMLGVVFTSHPSRTAVFDRDRLSAGNIAFGSNSFRGDYYASFLIEAIKQQEARTSEIVTR